MLSVQSRLCSVEGFGLRGLGFGLRGLGCGFGFWCLGIAGDGVAFADVSEVFFVTEHVGGGEGEGGEDEQEHDREVPELGERLLHCRDEDLRRMARRH